MAKKDMAKKDTPKAPKKTAKKETEMTLTEQAAYLLGLSDGLDYDKTSGEGKIIDALLKLTKKMADEIAGLHEDVEEIDDDLQYLNDYVEELDDDLEAVEDFLDDECDDEDEDEYDEDEDEDEYEDDGECDGDCENCDGTNCPDEDYYEIVCPSCGETVCFDQELDPENLVCPACGEKFGCIVDEDDFKKLGKDGKNEK